MVSYVVLCFSYPENYTFSCSFMSRTTWTSVLDLDLGCEVSGSVFPFLNRCRWMEESVRMLRRADGMQAASASDYHIPDVAGFQGKPPHPTPPRADRVWKQEEMGVQLCHPDPTKWMSWPKTIKCVKWSNGELWDAAHSNNHL